MMQVFVTDPQVLAKHIMTLLTTALTNTLISIFMLIYYIYYIYKYIENMLFLLTKYKL